jgi:LPXTG-site transpeptidase (sortase) family protein
MSDLTSLYKDDRTLYIFYTYTMKLSPKTKNIFFVAALALAIFTITYTTLLLFGFAPKQFQSSQDDTSKNIFQVSRTNTDTSDIPVEELDTNLIPQKIEIPKIGVSSVIQIPRAIDVTSLDTALAKGSVYYPGSGTLQAGNMFLFGHSTNWKVVNNQAYKTFNNLEKLVKGDSIELTSGGKKYIYEVTTVKRAAEDDVLIEFNKGDRMLTISTCDTFGQKQDRWVVEAEFKEVR